MPRESIPKVGLRATSGKRTLCFGLVRVGVGMSPLMEAEKRLSANLCDPESGTKVSRVWMVGDKIIDEPVKMYPYGDGYVELSEGELNALKPLNSDMIDLEANVRSSAIPAEQVEKSYLIWPQDATHNDGFAVILAYCRDNDRALIGTTTDNGTTKAFCIRYSDTTGTLVAQLLHYEASVRWSNVEAVAGYMGDLPEPDAALLDMAAQLFDGLPDEFDWSTVTDEYGEALLAAIAEKASTGAVSAPAPVAGDMTAPGGLLAALKASVEAGPAPEKSKRKKAAKTTA